VRVVLATVPANLRGWRPNASHTATELDAEAGRRWSEALATGRAQLGAGRLEPAAETLGRAADLAPQHAGTHFLLGQALDGLGRWDDARRAYRLACDLDASPIRRTSAIDDAVRAVAAERGALLVDADRIFAARAEHGLVGFDLIEDYVHPTREGHEIIAWHLLRAIEEAGWLGGEARADRALFERIVAQRRRRPLERNATWFYNTAVVLSDQGRLQEAIEKYREAIEIQPAYEQALLNLGYLLTRTGQSAEAVGVLRRLLATDPRLTATAAHVNLGNALQDLDRFEEAAAHYREALRLDPSIAFVWSNLGNALRKLGRLEQAVAHYERAYRMEPDDAVNHNGWGLALAGLGRLDEAVAHYAAALRLDPGYRNRGVALAALGRDDEAVAHYRRALRLRPDWEDLCERLETAGTGAP